MDSGKANWNYWFYVNATNDQLQLKPFVTGWSGIKFDNLWLDSVWQKMASVTLSTSLALFHTYRKTSSISGTKFQNLNVPCILLQLSSLIPLKLGVKLRMKM